MHRDYAVLIHVVDQDGRDLVHQDILLLRGGHGTSDWPAWRMARKRYELEVPTGSPEGQYVVEVGTYYWETGERLPVWGENMEPLVDDTVPLAPITVRQ